MVTRRSFVAALAALVAGVKREPDAVHVRFTESIRDWRHVVRPLEPNERYVMATYTESEEGQTIRHLASATPSGPWREYASAFVARHGKPQRDLYRALHESNEVLASMPLSLDS